LPLIETSAKGLLFDMDGVLISSIGSAERCWRQWAIHYEIPGAENFKVPHGVRARETVQLLRPDIDPDEGLRYIEDLEMEDVSDIQVLPGVRDLLHSLPPDRWSIVTSCTRRLMEARLVAANLPEPKNVITAESVSRGKPDPEPYRTGAALLGFAPAECIVVEDAPSGVQAGIAAGSRVLALLTSTPAFELEGASWIAPSLHGVTARLVGDVLSVSIPQGA
jgi:sugar-phosphatase